MLESDNKNKVNYTQSKEETMLGSHVSASSAEESTKDINKGYLFFNVLTISLGFMQFGVGMNSWSNTQDAF
jgi:MFS family permease